jgi:hypothetical protein
MRMPKMQKITIKVLERRVRPFSDALIRDVAGGAPACVVCFKSGGPFTVSLSMKQRNRAAGTGFVCQECGKLSDRELIVKATECVAGQVAAQGGGGYMGNDIVDPPPDLVGGTIDAFLREMSNIAEYTMKGNKCVPSSFLTVTRKGKVTTVSTPFKDGDVDGKRRAADHMRQFMIDNDVVRYAFIAEAWQASPGAPAGVQPSADPDRKSIVTIYVQDHSGAMVGHREIFGDGGLNPTLGPLKSEVVSPEQNVGRFMDLLTPLPEPMVMIIKQFRLNGKPCCKPEVTHVQRDKLEDFPDEFMAIQQHPDCPDNDVVMIALCRIKVGNRVEVSEATWSAGIRSFVIDRNRESSIRESSAVDRRHWPIPETVLALVGQRIPNTENETVVLSSEQVKLANGVGTARWAKKQRLQALN